MVNGLAIVFACAALIALALTPLARRLAHRLGTLDHPAGRKAHASSTARLGGVAIAGAWVGAIAAAALGTAGTAVQGWLGETPLGPLLAGGLLVFAVGVADDLRPLTPRTKLLGQVLAAAVVAGAGVLIERITILDTTYELGPAAAMVTIAWVVLITNAFNLIDGLDGLATGLAIIAGATCAAIVIVRGDPTTAVLLVALLGALAGFLPFNFNPASIFLGDGGSLLIGFVLAVTAITGFQKGATVLAAAVPLLVFALPILETGTTVLRRLWAAGAQPAQAGVSMLARLVQPDRGHIHHTLLALGLSHRLTVLVLYLVAVGFSAIALLTMER